MGLVNVENMERAHRIDVKTMGLDEMNEAPAAGELNLKASSDCDDEHKQE